MHGPLFLRRSSLPFARLQTVKILHGSFDQALWPPPWPSILRAIKPAVCQASNHGPLFLTHSSLRLAKLQTLKMVRGSLATSMTLGRSSLPFARLQTLKMLRGSFDQALWPPPWPSVLKAFKLAVCQASNPENRPRQLRPGTNIFMAFCAYGVQACGERLQTLKTLRGSFDQELWPPPWPSDLTAFKPAVCQASKT